MEVYRQKPIFDLARAGYKALFALRSDDASYVRGRLADMRNKTEVPEPANGLGMIVGIHVRHGDTHPYEFQYRDSYVPLDRYSTKARELIHSAYATVGPKGGLDTVSESHSVILVASDDPEVYDADEMKDPQFFRAQDHILLASHPPPPPQAADALLAIRHFVPENVGWDGGFFAGMFWSLGVTTNTAVEAPEVNLPPTEEAIRLRELVGRAYLMDLAVLGQGAEKVVCTVSSMGCKVLAVMMGWERAMVEGGWVNVDGDFEWRGVAW